MRQYCLWSSSWGGQEFPAILNQKLVTIGLPFCVPRQFGFATFGQKHLGEIGTGEFAAILVFIPRESTHAFSHLRISLTGCLDCSRSQIYFNELLWPILKVLQLARVLLYLVTIWVAWKSLSSFRSCDKKCRSNPVYGFLFTFRGLSIIHKGALWIVSPNRFYDTGSLWRMHSILHRPNFAPSASPRRPELG